MTLRGKEIFSYLVFVVVVVLISCINSNAQSTEPAKPSVCPTISVSGPSGVTGPGETFRFTVSVEPEAQGLTYLWELSRGSIAEGQSTKAIDVVYTPDLYGHSVTATLKVFGLQDDCPNSASEVMSQSILLEPILLSEFSTPLASINEQKLREAVKDLIENPNNQGYIIEYFPERTSASAVKRKLDRLTAFLGRTLRFDVSRVTVVTSVSEKGPLTKIYRIPPGTSNPVP